MKTAIIIGATSGIGREVAISLIEQGCKDGLLDKTGTPDLFLHCSISTIHSL